MNRRTFLSKTSAGLTATLIAPGLWSCANRRLHRPASPFHFRPYRPGKTLGETWIVTPADGYYVNTYYNITPWSPSGRYLALTELPFQDRIAVLGDLATVVVIDLQERSIRRVYPTKSWGYQLGALLHWGDTDRYLYCNDVLDNGRTVGVQLDLTSGETFAWEGPKYSLDAKRGTAIGPTLKYLNTTQYAYSTPAKKAEKASFDYLPVGAATNEGLWETDIKTGKQQLLLSISDATKVLSHPEDTIGCTHYLFSSGYNREANRIMIVLRSPYPPDSGKNARNPVLLSCDRNGQHLVETISRRRWAMGGHHPNWHPDGEHITMNLTPKWLGDDHLRFCKFKWDGSDFQVLSDKILGSGHPSMRSDDRFLLSDAYPFEPLAVGNGEVPIRLIDLEEQKEHTIATVFTDVGKKYKMSRFWGPSKLDAHPVWNRDQTKVCFNGAPEGNRQVFITDLTDFFK